MGEIKDRVIRRLPVDAVQDQLAVLMQPVKDHLARKAHRRQLRRIAKQDQRRENLAQIVKLPFIQHRAFIDKADVQRIFAPLPAADEIRAAQPRRGERRRDRLHRLVKRLGTVERLFGQPVDAEHIHLGPLALPGQPFGDLLIFRVIDRGVENAVNGGGGHAAVAQDAGRFVGGGQNGKRALVLALFALEIARDNLDPAGFERAVQLGQQQGLARARLADHRQHPVRSGIGIVASREDINPRRLQRSGDPVPGLGLILGELHRQFRGGLGEKIAHGGDHKAGRRAGEEAAHPQGGHRGPQKPRAGTLGGEQ